MNLIFISNNTIEQTVVENHSVNSLSTKSGLGSLLDTITDKSGNTIFVIDVHCTFINGAGKSGIQLKLQEQGGVIIYRHLLNKFKDCQDKLKVIFYSPISGEYLVRLKSENYILNRLPLLETKYDGNFGKELDNIIFDKERDGWSQFNVSSENLLSGWAASGQKKIKTDDKKILFIDDQQSEWEVTFSEMFPSDTVHYIENKKGLRISSQSSFRHKLDSNFTGFISDLENSIKKKKPDLIFSDFYLREEHEITEWKDVKKIESISGNKVFSKLRNLVPATPYVFHTSSNKANIYKFFDARGVDDWIVKDVRVESNKDERKANFKEFRDCIESFLCSEIYEQLNSLWIEIERIEKNTILQYWWSNRFKNLKESILGILKESWFGLRRVVNKEVIFERVIYSKNFGSEDTFTASSVIISMGKIVELLGFHNLHVDAPENSGLADIVRKLRNIASHGRKDLYCFSIQDGIFATHLTITLLQQTVSRNDLKKTTPNPKYRLRPSHNSESFKYALFWLYLQLYNTKYVEKHLPENKTIIEKRINEIFLLAKGDSGFTNVLDDYFSKIKRVDPKLKTSQLEKDSNGKFIISAKA
jgi:CheY-like chemotaxis protein